ncbi:sel1 repeat family protein [Permianibacter sp. IMCC34836]|uniref:tetratricopeptide repeat protein n=1 Tax=Permianibacter fluminis TaxID=2738515 RepID=UPI001557A99D|nr:tetratricopeptide repeat protein [Permianibacter fluminis]NQD35463.1 sel1 repeat family protein [Permianibacter fluminis]
MRSLPIATLVALMLFAFPSVHADDSTDPAKVQRFEVYKELAEQGDARAQFQLGTQYFLGQGTAADKVVGVQWIRKAADAGVADAQEFFAMALQEGVGTERNVAEAQRWFVKAAEQGKARSQRLLAAMLLTGTGGEKNAEQARIWLTKAAEQNDSDAVYLLGLSHFDGAFGTPDYAQAKLWLSKAYISGKPEAADYVGQIHERGVLGSADVVQAVSWYLANYRLNEATSLLRLSLLVAAHPEWTVLKDERLQLSPVLGQADDAAMLTTLRAELAAGDATALLSYGVLQYLGARGVSKDHKAAFASFKAAADKGSADARFLVARQYASGDGVEANRVLALQGLQALVNENHLLAQAYLGHMLRFDSLTARNVGEAERLLTTAAQRGSIGAASLLAYLYETGKDFSKDNKKAFEHQLQAARGGMPFAQSQVAGMYFYGTGVSDDKAAASAWLALSKRVVTPSTSWESRLESELRDKDRKRATRLLGELQAQQPTPLAVLPALAVGK